MEVDKHRLERLGRQGAYAKLSTGMANHCVDESGKCVAVLKQAGLRSRWKSGAGGGSRTLTGLLSPADFLTDYGFRRPDTTRISSRFAVWTIPSPSPGMFRGLGAARLVSTPSRPTSRQAWLGIATDEEVSPSLGSSASPVSQASTQDFLKSAASAIPPRPRGYLIAYL